MGVSAFRPRSKKMPAATKSNYGSQRIVGLGPAGQPLSWDNARIRLGQH